MTAVTTEAMTDDELDAVFFALADPTRRAMLGRLAADGDATGAELGADLPISQQAVSKHLQVLERAGLITRTPDAQRRTCHLAPERLETAIDWIAHHRQLWADRYDRLDAHLQTIRPGGTPPSRTTKETNR